MKHYYKYFAECESIEDVKALFKKWAKKLHPDCGGSQEEFVEMKKEYDRAFEEMKYTFRNSAGQTYTKENTTENAEEYAEIIIQMMKMQGVKVELIGTWLWATGNTKVYKEELKALGFKYSAKKQAWSWHSSPYYHRSRYRMTMDDIRNRYGTATLKQA